MNSRQCREKKDRKTTQSLQSIYTTENTFLGEDAAWAERAAGTTQKDHKLAVNIFAYLHISESHRLSVQRCSARVNIATLDCKKVHDAATEMSPILEALGVHLFLKEVISEVNMLTW